MSQSQEVPRVIVFVPFPRPQGQDVLLQAKEVSPVWTDERDQKLWNYVSVYPHNSVKWDVVASKLAISADQCIIRFLHLYQHQLQHQLLQQRRAMTTQQQQQQGQSPSSKLLAASPSRSNSARSSFSSSPAISPSTSTTLVGMDARQRHDGTIPSGRKSRINSLSWPSKHDFIECVERHNFEWNSIGRDLNQNPYECRELYLAYVSEEKEKAEREGIETYGSSSSSPFFTTASQQLDTNSKDIDFPFYQEYDKAWLQERPTSPSLSTLQESLSSAAAFALDEHRGSSLPRAKMNRPELGAWFGGDSIDQSTLESAFMSTFLASDE